jgi:hypothetical protein
MIQLLFLMVADIVLTYYLMFLDIKKDTFDYRDEKGLLARFLIKHIGLSPIGFLIQIFFGGLLIIGIMYIALIVNVTLQLSYMLYGIYVMIIFSHIVYILQTKRNWSNVEFWVLYKKLNAVKK